MTDPQRARDIGARGRRHALTHTVAGYGHVLLDAGDRAMRARSLIHGIRDLSTGLARVGLDRDGHLREGAAAAVSELFLTVGHPTERLPS
jgi:hypothetical protein